MFWENSWKDGRRKIQSKGASVIQDFFWRSVTRKLLYLTMVLGKLWTLNSGLWASLTAVAKWDTELASGGWNLTSIEWMGSGQAHTWCRHQGALFSLLVVLTLDRLSIWSSCIQLRCLARLIPIPFSKSTPTTLDPLLIALSSSWINDISERWT